VYKQREWEVEKKLKEDNKKKSNILKINKEDGDGHTQVGDYCHRGFTL